MSKEEQETASKQEPGRTKDNDTDSITLAPGEFLAGTLFKAPTPEDRMLAWRWLVKDKHPSFPKIRLSGQDITRWKMAWRAIQAFKVHCSDDTQIRIGNAITSRCGDWPDTEDIFKEFSTALGFSAAAFIYGGLHALAWFAHFESSTQQLLWRISASVVMSGVPVMYALAKVPQRSWWYLPWQMARLNRLLVLLAYTLARAYLVIECFINLSRLPAGVYDVPSWAAYFPHIS